jgi:hypothetical protein
MGYNPKGQLVAEKILGKGRENFAKQESFGK